MRKLIEANVGCFAKCIHFNDTYRSYNWAGLSYELVTKEKCFTLVYFRNCTRLGDVGIFCSGRAAARQTDLFH